MGMARRIRQSCDLERTAGLGPRREGRTDTVAMDDEVADGCGLSYEVLEGVGLIRIDRPDKLGAFTWKMIDRWTEALVSAQCDDAVRAVVLTGTGPGLFAFRGRPVDRGPHRSDERPPRAPRARVQGPLTLTGNDAGAITSVSVGWARGPGRRTRRGTGGRCAACPARPR